MSDTGKTELPTYKANKPCLCAIALAIEELKRLRKKTQKHAAIEFDNYLDIMDPPRVSYSLPPIVEQQHISDLKNPEKGRTQIAYPDFSFAAWKWLLHSYEDILTDCYFNPLVRYAPQNPTALALHQVLSPQQPFMTEMIARFQGRYLLFRHYFIDPTRVMVSEITCGQPDDPTAFTMTSVYEGIGKIRSKDTVEGQIIPYAGGVLFIGRFVQMRGPFVVAFSNPHGGDRIDRAEGVMLAAASGELPVAYPVLMLPGELGVRPGVYEAADVEADPILSLLIKPVLRRGIIDWHPARDLTPLYTIR